MDEDVYSHTHKEPKQLFQSCWGRWLYCYPSMDVNLNETQPLLLKHTLTPFLMVDCNTSPFALKLYSEQVYIYCQEKCWATAAHTLFFHFCLVLSRQIKHSFKHNSIQINSNTELRWYNLDKPMLVHSVPTAHWRWEKMGKKMLNRYRQHFCHRRCSKHLIDADSRINLALFSFLSLSADILKRPNLTLS